MKTGIQQGSRRSQMLYLIAHGVNTSVDIASKLGAPLGSVASELYYLEKETKLIRRVGAKYGKGRPRIVWGLRA